eukprot:13297984-Alexandrium_andersonii.AAC.1
MAAAREAQRAAAQARWESRQAHAYTDAQRHAAASAGPLATSARAPGPLPFVVEDYVPLGHPAANPAPPHGGGGASSSSAGSAGSAAPSGAL